VRLSGFRFLEDADADYRVYEQHLSEEFLHIGNIGFRKRWQSGRVPVVQFATFRLSGPRDQLRFEVLDMSLV
jgi:hypothetical protein